MKVLDTVKVLGLKGKDTSKILLNLLLNTLALIITGTKGNSHDSTFALTTKSSSTIVYKKIKSRLRIARAEK